MEQHGRCRPTRELRSDAEHERPCEVNHGGMPRVPADLSFYALLCWRSLPQPNPGGINMRKRLSAARSESLHY
jgi:hypothetical protein